ncbi:type II toxin-antitoxin system PemK/MazF family toxin [Lichenicoccus sp.]|uniref:type II toxin-antitoxin system PemK/MazF family toxin n=1 Tax=Lichenicoccus sp. TaxID=2781899 RepID=UPI003D09CA0D
MAAYEVWDLVKVPFPYTNRPVQQRRPALVVATPHAPGAPDLLWVLMVTSAVHRGWLGDVVVSDLNEAGLPAPSIVRPIKIATIEAGDAVRIGRLPQADRADVARVIRRCLSGAVA